MSAHRQFRFGFESCNGLSPLAYLVAKELDRTPRKYDTCLQSTRSIAAAVGRSIRSVQLAFRELTEAGLIEVKRCRRWLGRLVNSGHRIALLWRSPRPAEPARQPPPETNFLGAMDCARPAQEIAPDPAFPPDPPLEVLESALEVEGDGEPAPPPPEEVVSIPEKAPEPDPALVARVAKVHPTHPAPARLLGSLLARFARGDVDAAIGRTEARAAKGTLTSPGGHLIRSAEGIAGEYGPAGPPRPPTREELNARARSEREARMERMRAFYASV